MKGMSSLLDGNVAEEAVALVFPSITELLQSRRTLRKGCVIVVLEPLGAAKVGHEFTGKLDEAHDYNRIAFRKALKAWETKMNTSLLQAQKPGLFGEGDTHFGGGVCLDGIAAVGVSGLEEENDEMIAMWVATAIKRLLISKMKKFLESGKDFF